MHFIELVIEHQATHVTIRNRTVLDEVFDAFERMPHITHLYASSLGMASLPVLPPNLEWLECSHNLLIDVNKS